MTDKQYRLTPAQIAALAVGFGSCFATDRIAVDGAAVGYCYRESPDSPHDSGCRFFAADESDNYVRQPSNVGHHDVNTIANYDQGILPVLEPPFGSALERGMSGRLEPVTSRTSGD